MNRVATSSGPSWIRQWIPLLVNFAGVLFLVWAIRAGLRGRPKRLP